MKAKLFQLVWHAREASKNEPILAIDFHPFHSLLATAGMDNFVRIWRINEPPTLSALVRPPGGAAEAVTTVVAAPMACSSSAAGTLSAAASKSAGLVEFLFTMSAHNKSVNALRWSPTGDALASAGDDGDLPTL